MSSRKSLIQSDAEEYLEVLGFDVTAWGSSDSTKTSSPLRALVETCTDCNLSKSRRHALYGEGAPNARLMFIGEAPSLDDEAKKRPFAGPAGDLLTKMIEAMGLNRSQVFLTTAVKCAPPEGRSPEPHELSMCRKHLVAQIRELSPQVIVCLGQWATRALLGDEAQVEDLRGSWTTSAEWAPSVQIMPTLHPAQLLRRPELKKIVWDDLKLVMTALANPNK